MEISIENVTRIHLSRISAYEMDEVDDDQEDDLVYRTLTIETATGELAIDISARSEQELEVVADV
jgi:hypothetical protein